MANVDGVVISTADEDAVHADLLDRLNAKGGRLGGLEEVAFGYLTPDGESLTFEASDPLPEGMTRASLQRLLQAELPQHEVVDPSRRESDPSGSWKFD